MNSQRSRATPLAASGEVELNRAAPVSTPAVERLLDTIKWNSDGLVVAIAQHVDTGDVLMQAFANRDAVSATLASGHATFWSRSRNSLWTKGESSSNFINVVATYLDCDSDSIIYLGVPDGPSCHTGEHTCFFVRAEDAVAAFGSPAGSAEGVTAKQVIKSLPKSRPLMTLQSLEDTIGSRLQEVRAAAANPAPAVPGKKPSWTARLLSDEKLLCSKIKEEAAELCATLTDKEGSARTASEMADLLYHSMVLMAANGTSMADVLAVLRSRFGVWGVWSRWGRGGRLPGLVADVDGRPLPVHRLPRLGLPELEGKGHTRDYKSGPWRVTPLVTSMEVWGHDTVRMGMNVMSSNNVRVDQTKAKTLAAWQIGNTVSTTIMHLIRHQHVDARQRWSGTSVSQFNRNRLVNCARRPTRGLVCYLHHQKNCNETFGVKRE
eukprot:jgi/Mesvir1/1590/Mv14558-RA.1